MWCVGNIPCARQILKLCHIPVFQRICSHKLWPVFALAQGTSIITEGVWDNRYRYVDEFKRLGANIRVDGKIAVVEGVDRLMGAPIRACDLRAGAAMVVASLAAEGTTEIDSVYHIERGYENLIEKLKGVGADIEVVSVPDGLEKQQVG